MPGTRFNLSITSSGGVGLPGDATVWGSVGNWSGLDDIVGPLRTGDFAEVDDLGPDGSTGTAMYNGADWGLHRAVFATVADLLAFGGGGELILADAIAFVGTGAETDPVYYYAGGEWVRTPEDTKYIWPNALNWAGLPDNDSLKNGDEAFVEFLGTTTSYGTARWSDVISDWELKEVIFAGWDPVVFETNFPGIIAQGAILRSDDGSWEAPIYLYDNTGLDPEWVRSPRFVTYNWPQRSTWGYLDSIEGMVDGDRAQVALLGPTGSSGVARYEGVFTDQWQLEKGVFATAADMVTFTATPRPIQGGALATIGTGAEAETIYFYDSGLSAWVRTPAGTKYIWPQVALWSDLLAPTFARPHAINNDEVHVQELNVSHSSGTAQKHGGGWRLIEGRWPSVEDMNAWDDDDILTGARGLVDPDKHWDEDAIPYYYNGSVWLLAGGPPAEAKAITEIELGQLDEPGQNINVFFLSYPISEITETP